MENLSSRSSPLREAGGTSGCEKTSFLNKIYPTKPI